MKHEVEIMVMDTEQSKQGKRINIEFRIDSRLSKGEIMSSLESSVTRARSHSREEHDLHINLTT